MFEPDVLFLIMLLLLLGLDFVLDWPISPEVCFANFCEAMPVDGAAVIAWIRDDAGAVIWLRGVN